MTQRISFARVWAVLTTLSLLAVLLPMQPLHAAAGTFTLAVVADPDPLSEEVGEYVSISYDGTEQVDITGWEILDNAGRIHVIGSAVLADGDTFTVCRNDDEALNGGLGCDEDWGAESLGNTTESITLNTAAGAEVVATGNFDAEPGVVVNATATYDDGSDVVTVPPTATLSATPQTLTVDTGALVNFVAGVTAEDGFDGSTTVVTVSDNGAAGSFYNGTIGGACNNPVVDADNEFVIGAEKGICYSNDVAGEYTLTVTLLEETGGAVVGAPVDLTVTVSDVVVVDETATSTEDTATSTDETATTTDDSATSTVDSATSTDNSASSSDDGTTDNSTTTDNSATSTDNTASSSDDGTDTGTTTPDGTDTDNGTTTEDGSGTTTDSTTGGGSDTAVASPEEGCEYQGYKYDADGNPLSGWDMSLRKVITNTDGTVLTYVIDTDTTDAGGYYCLRWTDGTEWTPAYVQPTDAYTFEYRVAESMQTGWEFVSAMRDGAAATEAQLSVSDTDAQVMVGEANGFVINDAEYSVDFYNTMTATGDGSGNGTTTSNGGSGGSNGGSGGGSSANNDDNGNGGSSSSGTRVGARDGLSTGTAQPTVAGISDSSASAPQGMVLGEQVSAVPFGGVNAGAGSTAPTIPAAGTFAMLVAAVAAVLGARRLKVNV